MRPHCVLVSNWLGWIQVGYLEDGLGFLRTLVGCTPLDLQLPQW